MDAKELHTFHILHEILIENSLSIAYRFCKDCILEKSAKFLKTPLAECRF